jgi:signal transduction histidine kinase
MEIDDLSKLFTRFYRGDPSRSSSQEGSGLGLAIAKHIVNAHDGTIEARNNSGLEIIITLPVEKEGEHEANTDH